MNANDRAQMLKLTELVSLTIEAVSDAAYAQGSGVADSEQRRLNNEASSLGRQMWAQIHTLSGRWPTAREGECNCELD